MDLTDYTDEEEHDLDWRDYVVGPDDEGGLLIDTEDGPGNVSDWHLFRQVVICDILDNLGAGSITLEDSTDFGGLRFDLTAVNPNGTIVGGEVGEFNCPTRKVADRFMDSYEHVDFIVWWGKHADYELRVIDNLRFKAQEKCEICEGSPLSYTMYNFPPNHPYEDSGCETNIHSPLMFDLTHMFEPHVAHEQINSLTNQDTEQDSLSRY